MGNAANMEGASSARRPPRLSVPLSDADMQQVIAGARRVLKEIGIHCQAPEIRKQLASLPAAWQSGERVYYGDAAVDAILADSRKAAMPEQTLHHEPFGIGPPWCCLQIADAKNAKNARNAGSGTVRPPTAQDAARATRLLEGVGAPVHVAPVAPVNVSPQLRNLACLRTVLLHSREGRHLPNPPVPEQLSATVDIGAAAGRTARAFIMVLISPLRFDADGIGYFLKYRDVPGLQLDLAGSMPCTGLTSPMHLPGTLVQSLAEAIAVAACTRALGCGGEVGAIRCDPCDMRSGNYVIGSPEFQLLDMATRTLYRSITGATHTSGAFRSMAKMPDAQAMAERCFTVLFQALQGARNFGHAGQMSMDEVFSPEQVVLDYEILRYVERIAWGMEWHEDAVGGLAVDDAVEMIRQGVETGHYLDAEQTIKGYREFFHSSKLFGYEKLNTWLQHGAPSVLARASERVEQTIAATPPCVLPADRARDVERVFQRACRTFA
jgi:trimethylamine:corrinoid methyltransferase-like protein